MHALGVELGHEAARVRFGPRIRSVRYTATMDQHFTTDHSIRPCSALEAVSRAKAIANNGGQYVLGAGDYRPQGTVDVPWTSGPGGLVGSDCAGFAISWAYKLPRHREGFNRGPWSSVSDDLNCNSAIEDAQHARELFDIVSVPQLGDLLAYPTFRLQGEDGKPLTFIGHVCIVVGVDRVKSWSPVAPAYELLDVAQCKGPNGRAPGVILSDGSIWSHHDAVWPKAQHRTWMLRAKA